MRADMLGAPLRPADGFGVGLFPLCGLPSFLRDPEVFDRRGVGNARSENRGRQPGRQETVVRAFQK